MVDVASQREIAETPAPDSRWQRLVRSPWTAWALIYAVGVLALGRIRPEVVGANDSSRYATMIAIVEHGTYYIDGVHLANRTMDKVRVGRRDLSTKPPVLSTLGAAIYAVLHHGFGLTFLHNEGLVVRVIVALLCTLPLVLLLWMFHGLLRREGLAPGVSLGITALLGLGTLAFPFGTILVNHLPSTAALFGAFVCARELRSGRRSGWRWAFGAGLLGCLAVTFELPGIFGAAAVTLYLFSDRRRWALAGVFLAGLALPAALHLWITWRTTGHVLPVQLRSELWHFAGSYWNRPRSWDALREPKWQYGLQCFFGGRGLFTLTPVLLVSLVGLWRGLRRGGVYTDGAAGRAETLTILGAFAGLAGYIVLQTNNYGGGHYGMRWFLMMVPLLFVLLAPVLAGWRGWSARVTLPLLILPGLYTAQIFWFGKPTVYELLLMKYGWLVLPP